MFEVLSTSGDTHLGGDDFDKVGCSYSFIFFVFFYLHTITSLICLLFYSEDCRLACREL